MIKAIICFHFFFKIAFGSLPHMHVYLAERYLEDKLLSEEEKRSFLLGTLFPDIRYLGTIQREKTHLISSLSEIENEKNLFIAGMMFHAFVDERRDHYILENYLLNLYSDIEEQYRAIFMKLVEDEIICELIDWKAALGSIGHYDENEFLFVDDRSVEKWHQVLTKYYSFRPSIILYLLKVKGQGFFQIPASEVKKWSKILSLYTKNEKVIDYVSGFISIFEDEIFEKNIARERSNFSGESFNLVI